MTEILNELPNILPIDALIYNKNKVDISSVAAPPYDVIDKTYQTQLYERDKYNIVRLILSNEANPYESAKRDFEAWKKEEILIKTKKPSIFYVVQKYKNQKGETIERKGFIARNKIEDFETKRILPHEYTMGGPKEDRFKLISSTKAFFSQIFMVYDDKSRKIEQEVGAKYLSTSPDMDVIDDYGVQNLVWIIDDENDIKLIQEVLKDKTLLIADGHHRYETSMKYAKENPDNAYAQYVMSYFTNASDNLVIYPTHRIIEKDIEPHLISKSVEKYFDIETSNNKQEFLERIEVLNNSASEKVAMGLILRGDNKFYILNLKKGVKNSIDKPQPLRDLDLTVLHEIILKKELNYSDNELMAQNGIKYEKREDTAFNSVGAGASACFIMAYPKMEDVLKISSNGLRMPQKSTYFYPKLLSGIVVNPIG